MITRFFIENVNVLPNGKVLIAGTPEGPRVVAGSVGHCTVGTNEASVTVISVAIVDPPKADRRHQLLHVTVAGSAPATLIGTTLEFSQD